MLNAQRRDADAHQSIGYFAWAARLNVSRNKTFSTALALALAAIAVSPSAVFAKTCSDVSVHAAGEPASFEWLARIKTHANWRAKVRGMPNLGDPYANWDRAADSTERCYSGPKGTICEFTGTPCRKD